MDSKPLMQQFQDDIDKVVDKYRDQGITVGETVGSLLLVILDIRDNSNNDDNTIPGNTTD